MINWIKNKIKWILIATGIVLVALAGETLLPDNPPIENIPSLTVNNKIIQMVYADENEGETLIIRSNAKDYYSFGFSKVYFSVENKTGQDQNVSFSFGLRTENLHEMRNLKQFIANKITTIPERIIPEQKTATTTIPAQIIPAKMINEADWKDIGQKDFTVKTITRKSINNYKTKSESDFIQIKADEIVFFKADVRYMPEEKGQGDEFFIEAFGDKGGYGHLDPVNWSATDNFESYSTGDLHGGNGGTGWSAAWNCTGPNQALYDVVSSPAYTGSRGVYLFNVPDDGSQCVRTLSADVSSGAVQFALYDGANDAGDFYVMFKDTSNNAIAQVEVDDGGQNIVLHNTADVGNINLVTGYSLSTWYLIELEIDTAADQYRARVNGGAWSNYVGQRDAGAGDINYIQLRINEAMVNQNFDDIDVGASAAAPPAAGVNQSYMIIED